MAEDALKKSVSLASKDEEKVSFSKYFYKIIFVLLFYNYRAFREIMIDLPFMATTVFSVTG